MSKKKIALVCGGYSSEMEVSLRSADGLYQFLDKNRYDAWIVVLKREEWYVRISDTETAVVDRNDFSFVLNDQRIRFDYAWITIHGTPGEDGRLQGYFDMIAMPYNTCGVLASSLTFHKFACNHFLKGFGLQVAESLLLRKGQQIATDELIDKVGLPCFIKSNVGGSSFGVSKVKVADEVKIAIENAFQEGDEVIVESFLEGMELTCGCYKTKKGACVLPLTEVVSQNEFFDYEAKYQGKVSEITPARIPDTLRDRIQQITSMIYDILDCRGIIRADYIWTKNGIFLLEVNTTPGMTATSFIPQQVAAAGKRMSEVMAEIIENEVD